MFSASRVWRKNTGPGESRRMRQAIHTKSGNERISRIPATTTSIVRLTRSDVREQRDALDLVDVDVRPDDLEHPRHDVDLDVALLEAVDRLDVRVALVHVPGDDHTLDVPVADDRREVRRRPE